jgi:predicted TIM-barrel fold metal-dependent hydrolase
VEQVIERYDRDGIEKGMLLPIVSPEIYLPQANEEILDMCEKYPDRLFPFCNVDPRALTNSCDAPLDRLLRYYKDKGCRGLGEVMPNMPFMHPMVQNLFRHAQDAELPVSFCGSDQNGGDFGLYDDPGLPQLEHTLQKFPRLVVLGHAHTLWAEVARLDTPAQRKTVFRHDGEQVGFILPEGPIKEEGVFPKLLRRYPNLYGELNDSAWTFLQRDHDYALKFIVEFQNRLLFATDFCNVEAQNCFSMLNLLLEWRKSNKISEEVFRKVARENAISLFSL